MIRLLTPSLVAGMSIAVAAQGAGSAITSTRYAVAYVEVESEAVARMRSVFARYRDASRPEAGFGDLELLEQGGHPGMFVVIERWRNRESAEAHGKADSTKQFHEALDPLRVSGYDERPYKDLATGQASAAGAETVYVVTHVDVAPPGDAAALLRRLADDSRNEPGCLRFDILQHAERANHFTIVEAWRTRAARDRHVAAAHTRRYRDALQPMIGSPLDERLMRQP